MDKLGSGRTESIKMSELRHGATASSIAAIFSHQLNLRFDETGIDYVVMRRKDLARHLTINALEKSVSLPRIKDDVRKTLLTYGIGIRYKGGLVEFGKREPTKKD